MFDGDFETGSTKLHVASGAVVVRTKKGKVCEVTAGHSVVISDIACTPIPGFDPGFPSEFTGVQEFAEVQAGAQGFFGAQSPAMFIAPTAAIGGAVAGGVVAGVSNNSSNGGESSFSSSCFTCSWPTTTGPSARDPLIAELPGASRLRTAWTWRVGGIRGQSDPHH